MLHNKHSRNLFNNIAKHLGTTSCDEICNKILRPPAMLRNDRFELPFNARMKELGSLPRRRSSSHLATDSGTLTGICPLKLFILFFFPSLFFWVDIKRKLYARRTKENQHRSSCDHLNPNIREITQSGKSMFWCRFDEWRLDFV